MRQKFDKAFVQRLRHEVGDGALDVVWYAGEPQLAMARGVGGVKIGWRDTGRRGCWVVTKTCKLPIVTEANDALLLTHQEVVIKVFKLNGKYGHPRIPGHWVIRALCASDACRRGAMARLRELNSWQQDALHKKYVVDQAAGASSLDAMGLRSALMKVRDEFGVESSSREDHIANMTALEAGAEEAEASRKAMVAAESLL